MLFLIILPIACYKQIVNNSPKINFFIRDESNKRVNKYVTLFIFTKIIFLLLYFFLKHLKSCKIDCIGDCDYKKIILNNKKPQFNLNRPLKKFRFEYPQKDLFLYNNDCI